jgi:hypothetical protein
VTARAGIRVRTIGDSTGSINGFVVTAKGRVDFDKEVDLAPGVTLGSAQGPRTQMLVYTIPY